MRNFDSVPRLSRSLSSSESTASSSPREGILDMQAGALSPSNDSFKKQQETTSVSSPRGSVRSCPSEHVVPVPEPLSLRAQVTQGASTLDPPKSFSASIKNRMIDAQKRLHTRYYHPYKLRNRVTPLELRFAARSLGSSSYTSGMAMEEVIQGKEYFATALSAMPDRTLLKAYQAKQANRDCVAHRVALSLAEIESAERYKDYLAAVHGQQEGILAVTDTQLQVLADLVDDRGLSDVEDDGGYHRAVYADELVALTVAEEQVNQMKEVVDSRAHPIWPDLNDDSLSEDEDNNVPFTGLLSSDDSVL